MNRPQVVSRDRWSVARKGLLAQPKRLTRALSARLRALPLAEGEQAYVAAGKPWYAGGDCGQDGIDDFGPHDTCTSGELAGHLA